MECQDEVEKELVGRKNERGKKSRNLGVYSVFVPKIGYTTRKTKRLDTLRHYNYLETPSV
jgi:hypothetical protein